MFTSLFSAYVDKYFKGVVGKVSEKFNDKSKEPDFLFEKMTTEDYSADLTWNATTLNHSIVAADVVSLDSSLPLKKRGTIRTASGDVTKLGIKYKMKEKAITDIQVMAAKGQTEKDIAAKILANVPRAIKGIKVRLEIMFQQALSSGQLLIEDPDNEGTGVRASFGYADNHFKSVTGMVWSDTDNAKPLDDIQQLFDEAAAESDTIERVFLSKQYFDYARKSDQIKELVATYLKQVIVSSLSLPVPTKNSTLEALKDEFGCDFEIVDSNFRIEAKDGSQTNVKPWVQGNVVAITNARAGRIVYGTLAEESNKVAGVAYQKSGNYILVSEYAHNEPSLEEFTAAQALAIPVIDDGDHVYVLQADKLGRIVVDDEVSLLKAGETKVLDVKADSAVTASVPAAATWLTATVDSTTNALTLTASANGGSSSRSTTVTLTDADGNTASVEVTQLGA